MVTLPYKAKARDSADVIKVRDQLTVCVLIKREVIPDGPS